VNELPLITYKGASYVFDDGWSGGKEGNDDTVYNMLYVEKLPVFVVFSIMIGKSIQGSAETVIDSINSYRKVQDAYRKSAMDGLSTIQKKQEELAQDSWEAIAGTSPSGSFTTEKDEKPGCGQVVGAVFMYILAIITFGLSLLITNLIKMIAESTMGPGEYHSFMKDSGWALNSSQVIADAIVESYCEVNSVSDEDKKKAKMVLGIVLLAIQAVAMIIAAIILTVVTFGSGAPALVAAIVTTILALASAALSIVQGAIEVNKGFKALEAADQKLALNKLMAAVENMQIMVETMGEESEVLIEMFSTKSSDVIAEYEKATRILKEYNDTKHATATNIGK
jgi:Ca2+/Na+ antiporter